MRIDLYLVENGIVKSRERAKEHIKNGDVRVNGEVVVKPSYNISDGDDVLFTGNPLGYVGRGGLKLEKAIRVFKPRLEGRVCMDIGASTGGFTDCMLKNGAKLVYAIDVGHDQLDPILAENPCVVNMEDTNINSTSPSDFDPAPSFFSVDVSFVSLKNIIPKIAELIPQNGEAVFLIKPQFEVGKSDIGKRGIVKDRKAHIRVINEIIVFCSVNGLAVKGLDYSPISGGDGNIEYFAYITPNTENQAAFDVKHIVDAAFSDLKRKEK